jgi:hypothetical protein
VGERDEAGSGYLFSLVSHPASHHANSGSVVSGVSGALPQSPIERSQPVGSEA